MQIQIPFGKEKLAIDIKEERLRGVLIPIKHKTTGNEIDILINAFKHPIESPALSQLAHLKKNVLLITSDHTRPLPSKLTMPLLLEEIRKGNPDAHIKIMIATGFHRATTDAELIEKFGRTIVEQEEIVVHNSHNKEEMVFKGILPSGGELWLNQVVDWADLIVAEGFIEPHFFAGFSGGRKSILPGISYYKTVLANHCAEFIDNKEARTGNLTGNPIHEDMIFAAKVAKLAFILNVIIDDEKKVIKAYAGDPYIAHEKGCEEVEQIAGVSRIAADIVVTSNGGYPLDQNIYQTVKGMSTAEACVNEGGVIIMIAKCNDGHGGEDFYQWFHQARNAHDVVAKIKNIQRNETIPDQWQAQILARVMCRCKGVILVSNGVSGETIRDMHMHHASSFEEAMTLATQMTFADSSVVVIPDGVQVIIKSESEGDRYV